METLQKQIEKTGIILSDEQLTQFNTLLQELQNKNKEFNLTAIVETEDIILKHFVDSLSVTPYIPKNTTTFIDVGTGAGFPGLPIKIVRPEINMTLLESILKKTSFVNQVIKTLNLSKIKAINGRAEEAGQDLRYREQFDVAVARAVAELSVLVEYTLPFVKIGGIFIAQKKTAQEEIDKAGKAIETLGGQIKDIIPVTILGLEHRQIVIIEKIKETPEKYPRRPGMALKKPI